MRISYINDDAGFCTCAACQFNALFARYCAVITRIYAMPLAHLVLLTAHARKYASMALWAAIACWPAISLYVDNTARFDYAHMIHAPYIGLPFQPRASASLQMMAKMIYATNTLHSAMGFSSAHQLRRAASDDDTHTG